MIGSDEFYARMKQVSDELRNGPKAKGATKIFMPGEMEWDKRDAALSSGEIEITDAMVAALTNLSEQTNLEIKFY